MDNQHKISILGSEYTIETHKFDDDKTLKENGFCGYCSAFERKIVIVDYNDKKYYGDDSAESIDEMRKCTLRHEIIHAFFKESGLTDSANCFTEAWCKNEEVVDWFANQAPKIYKVFSQLDIL